MTRIPSNTLDRIRAASDRRKDAHARVVQVQRMIEQRRVRNRTVRVMRSERERGA